MRNGKSRIILFSILAIVCTAALFLSSCDHGNKPKEEPPKETYLKTDLFPKAPEGQTYVGFKIKWTDASGKQQEKTITSPSDFIFEGGVKAGEKPQIIPLIKDSSGNTTEGESIAVDAASGTPDYTAFVKAGIRNLKEEDYDKALESFEKAYKAEANNSTKTYYALVKLASISTKPETVAFMQNKIGLAKYPNKLNALVNLEWLEKISPYPEYQILFPKVIQKADWYKAFDPFLQIPAYILETSNGNFDQLIDELYSILFGKEFNEAKAVLNSIDASKPIEIDEDFLSLINLTKDQIGIDKLEVNKDYIMGIMGGLTIAKGSLEWLQSYSFNFKDISIFKWDWMSEEDILKNLGDYNKDQDPFNNGFLKGRSSEKMKQAKKDFVEGLGLMLKMYDSVTSNPNMPQDAINEVKEYEFIKKIVEEVKNAINEGREADFLIGTGNKMSEGFTEFKIDMGKVFTDEYFKLSNLFEMNGNKPKIHPAEGSEPAYMNFKLKSFMEDFVKIKTNNGPNTLFNNIKLVLPANIADKLITFYN